MAKPKKERLYGQTPRNTDKTSEHPKSFLKKV